MRAGDGGSFGLTDVGVSSRWWFGGLADVSIRVVGSFGHGGLANWCCYMVRCLRDDGVVE